MHLGLERSCLDLHILSLTQSRQSHGFSQVRQILPTNPALASHASTQLVLEIDILVRYASAACPFAESTGCITELDFLLKIV